MDNYEEKYYKKAEDKSNFVSGYRKYIVDIAENDQKNKVNVLDLGCGEGEFSNVFSEKVDYCGVDVSKFAVESAKEKNISGLGKFVLINSDLDKLPLDDNKFDFVFGVYSLEHFKKPKEMLDEAVRVLVSGGRLILLAPNLEFPLSYINAIRHKSFFYKINLYVIRTYDYLMRVFGKSRFRTLKENFTSATGKYERLDDDLTYMVSSYEVINYLRKKHNMKEIFSNKLREKNIQRGLKNKIRKIIALLPAMKYYGDVLFIVAQKS
ncbi:MAG: class I SAM-dependent methyltransferase [bacterium]|nr:class I SAM-dependent methyltransferase [bacterium]